MAKSQLNIFLHIKILHAYLLFDLLNFCRYFQNPTTTTAIDTKTKTKTNEIMSLTMNNMSSSQQQSQSQHTAMDEEDLYEHACTIWYNPPEGRAARELGTLTKSEREKVWADLTGNAELSSQDQRLEQISSLAELQQHLMELNQMLNQHAMTQTDALARALHRAQAYVCEVRNLVKFLRSQEWDVSKTYAMMVTHFQMKLDLFGFVERDVTLADLDQRTLQCLEHASYQLSFGTTDRAGRAFSIMNVTCDKGSFTREEILRSAWYQNMVLSEDESVQRLGIVRMGYLHLATPNVTVDHEFLRLVTSIIPMLPIRVVALYIVVTDNKGVNKVLLKSAELIVLMVNSFVRVRTRIIHGSFVENMYHLMCLGLPADRVPVHPNGTPKNEMLCSFLQQRQVWEQQHQLSALRQQQQQQQVQQQQQQGPHVIMD